MHKVIVEEPRHRAGWDKRFRQDSLPDELLPKYQGMRRSYARRKVFGEHLGPLKRWLRSNVGRVWNDVFAEACQVIKPNSAVRAHIRTHMVEYVERQTFLRNGEVWCRRRSVDMPVLSLKGHTVWPKFYVHPESGVLCEVPDHKRELSLRVKTEARNAMVRRWISDRLLLLNINGLWFGCEMRPITEAEAIPPFDQLVRLRLAETHLRELYDKSCYCVRKQQLSRFDLRLHGLKNVLNAGWSQFLRKDDLIGRMQRSNGNPVRDRLQNRFSCVESGPLPINPFHHGLCRDHPTTHQSRRPYGTKP